MSTLTSNSCTECSQLRDVIATAARNVSSLMGAYPDLYPRHAFQGTYEMLAAAAGINGYVANAHETLALPKAISSALDQIAHGPPIDMENDEVAAWAAGLATNALASSETVETECVGCGGLGSDARPFQLTCAVGHVGPFKDEHGYYEKRRLPPALKASEQPSSYQAVERAITDSKNPDTKWNTQEKSNDR